MDTPTYCDKDELLDRFGYQPKTMSNSGKWKAAKLLVNTHGIGEYLRSNGRRIVYLRSEVVAKAKAAMKPIPKAA